METLSLFEFTSRLGNIIHTNPDVQNVWLIAELSDVAVRGGHFYADLIQKNEKGQTIARMRSNLWASRFTFLRQRYLAERQEDLRNGIKVRIKGNATHHNQYGLSFNIVDIDPSYVDEGDILKRRMEILEAVSKYGIAENNKQLEMDMDAQRVAIISAEGAAGLGDFINQLSGNPNYKFTFKVFSSPMQGEKAAAGVIKALEEISGNAGDWDCVAIIRGGGATADMNCFDDLELAKNVCLFELPVIIGIGHERDNCVLDYIAHTRCKTPTAVAEFLIDHQRQAWQRAFEAVNFITREATQKLEGEKRHIAQIEAFIPSMANQMLEKERLRLQNITTAIPAATSGLTSREHTRLDSYFSQLSPAAAAAITRAKDHLRSTFGLIEVLKPENTLKRGYSITRTGGKAVRNASAVPPGTPIETQLASGTLHSTAN